MKAEERDHLDSAEPVQPAIAMSGEPPLVKPVQAVKPEHYREAIFEFFRLSLSPREVEYHWQRLLLHQSKLTGADGRRVDLRTAAFDYFLNAAELIHEPLVMERAEQQKTELMAYFDKLTGLHNFAYFEQEMRAEAARSRRYNTPICLLLMDLDGFKGVNDNLGHSVGNELLQRVGAVLTERLRESDLVARFGGDEFVALLHHTTLDDGRRVADSLRQTLVDQIRHRQLNVEGVSVTASFGLSSMPDPAKTAKELFDAADEALYRAKANGGNTVAA